MYNELKDQGLEVFGVTQLYGYYKSERNISPDAEFAKLAEFREEFKLPWPLIVGDESNFAAYGVNGIPQYVVIDRQGKVSGITIGYNEPLHEQLHQQVLKALAQKTASR